MRLAALAWCFGLPAAVCAAWTLVAGKDVSWDLLNYHYYAPFQLLEGRVQQDFFAASAQSYLNPLGYVPFYLMVAWDWHSVLASIALAALHSTSIGLLYLVAWRLFAHLPTWDRVVCAALAAALGALTGVYWMTVGGSILDPLLAPLMLGGLLLLLDAPQRPMRSAVLAGVLFGAAAALKYSNAVFAVAALPLVLGRRRAALAYVGGGVLAVALLAGPWLLLMAHEFGNPVFPLFNGWFRSPHALPVNTISVRFTPDSLAAALAFPWRVAQLDTALYVENFAPDLRFAALAIAAAVLAALAAARRLAPVRSFRDADRRVVAFFAVALVLWLATSANGRYGMVVLLLAGVCLARVVERLMPLKAARVVLLVLLAVQIVMTTLATPSRWYAAEPWSKRWLPYAVPERALREPALYLSVEELPMAVLAPFFHPGSSFVNLRGAYSVPSDSPRLAVLLERHRGAVRALGRSLQLHQGRPAKEALKSLDATLLRIGYRADGDDCFAVDWSPQSGDLLSRAANRLAPARQSRPSLFSAGSCALRPAPRDPARELQAQQVSSIFDRMEAACPGLFRGQRALTEPLGIGWSRLYPGLDVRLETDGRQAVLYRYRDGAEYDMGSLAAWAAPGRAPACPRQPTRAGWR